MFDDDGNNWVSAIEMELEVIVRLISETEKVQNPRVMWKIAKLKMKLHKWKNWLLVEPKEHG